MAGNKKHKKGKITSEERQLKRARRHRRIKKLLIWLIVLGILGSAVYVLCTNLKQEYAITYDEYITTTGTISNSLSFSGTLQAVNSATYTAENDGTVRQVNVKAGDEVKKGDVLIKLSGGQTVKAEFDGRINTIAYQEGDTVLSGDTLLQLVDFDHMQVSIRVDEYKISDVHVGDTCRITTTATESTFTSSIESINYVSSSTGAVAYYTAIANVNVTRGVYPGMQVTVTIPKDEASDVVILREAALSFDGRNQAYVYIMNDLGQLEQIYVKTGVSNGNYVEISEGLKSGQTVYVQAQKNEENASNIFQSLFGSTRYNRSQTNRNQGNSGTRSNTGGNFGGYGGNR